MIGLAAQKAYFQVDAGCRLSHYLFIIFKVNACHFIIP